MRREHRPPRSNDDSRTSAAKLRAAAHALAAAGTPVFPCVPGGKRPLTTHGFQDATTSHEAINRWWRRWPEANIAMPTGEDRWDVLDVDVKPRGVSGYAALRDLQAAGLVASWARIVLTPSGGLHVYFAGTNQGNGSIPGRGLDFRSTGGYVLVPPSQVTVGNETREYKTIAVSPDHQRRVGYLDQAAIRRHLEPAAAGRPRWAERVAADARLGQLVRFVANQHPEGGNRNMALFWAVNRAVENGTTDLTPLVQASLNTGLPRAEAERTVASALTRRSAIGELCAGPAGHDEGRRGPAIA